MLPIIPFIAVGRLEFYQFLIYQVWFTFRFTAVCESSYILNLPYPLLGVEGDEIIVMIFSRIKGELEGVKDKSSGIGVPSYQYNPVGAIAETRHGLFVYPVQQTRVFMNLP